MRRIRTALGALLAVSFLAVMLGALAAPVAVGKVAVEPEITYSEGGDGSISDLRLQIYRDGVKVLDRAPHNPCLGNCELRPVPSSYRPPARVVQLDTTPEPEVVFTLYRPYADCCIYGEVFRWDEATGSYLLTFHNFGDFGYKLKSLTPNGHPVFTGGDSRVAYRFPCVPCTIYPPQIWEYRSGKLVEVTRSHPGEVKRHLARASRFYRRIRGDHDVRSVLATLVADKCLLGRCASGFEVVRRAIRSGYIRRFDSYESGPYGRRYLKELRRFLKRLGYA